MVSEDVPAGEVKKGCSVRTDNSAGRLIINAADETQYRWWPQVEGRSTSPASSAGAVHPQDVQPTFEAHNRKLASRWFSALPTPNTDTDPDTPSHSSAEDVGRSTAVSYPANSTSSNTASDNTTSGEDDDRTTEGKGIPSSYHHPPMVSHASTAEESGMAPMGSSGSTATSLQLLFLVRHGETDMNAAGRLQGRGVDAILNGAGIRQATELGRFLRNVPFDTVSSSSLRRAHETAVIVVEQNVKCVKQAQTNESPADSTSRIEDCGGGDGKQMPVKKYEGLDELSWGELEGQDAAQEPWKSKLEALKGGWDAGHFDRAARNGESVIEVEARSRKAVESCLEGGKALNLIVSHGRTLRILISSLTGMGLDNMTNMGKVPNTALYVIEARRSSTGAARSYHLLALTS